MRGKTKFLPYTFISLLVLILSTSCSIFKSQQCDLQSESKSNKGNAHSINIYEEVFSQKNSCLPEKLILRVPNNLAFKAKKERKAPSMMTIVNVTSTSKKEIFYIRRIDKFIDNSWRYTSSPVCYAWQWGNNDNKQILSVSLERNLQIFSKDIESIIFIVSIPSEVAANVKEIDVKPFTLGKIGNSLIYKNNTYKNLNKALKAHDESTNAEYFLSDRLVDDDIVEDLKILQKVGGLQYITSLDQILKTRKPSLYKPSSPDVYCDAPSNILE